MCLVRVHILSLMLCWVFVSHLPRAHYFLYRLSACTSISNRAANPHPVDTVYVGIAVETLWAATLGEVLFVQYLWSPHFLSIQLQAAALPWKGTRELSLFYWAAHKDAGHITMYTYHRLWTQSVVFKHAKLWRLWSWATWSHDQDNCHSLWAVWPHPTKQATIQTTSS